MAKARKPLPSLEWLQPRLRLTRALALLSYLGLMVLLAVSTWLDDLPQQARLSLLALQLVPLAILLPGIVLGHARGHAWACFAINLYFIQGVLAAFQPQRLAFGLTECALTVVFFLAAMMYTRYRFQHERRLAGER